MAGIEPLRLVLLHDLVDPADDVVVGGRSGVGVAVVSLRRTDRTGQLTPLAPHTTHSTHAGCGGNIPPKQ